MLKYVTAALVGATLLIGGCNSPTGDTGVVVQPDPRADFVVQYIPTANSRRAMPYPNDIWGGSDGTLNVPGTLSSLGAPGYNLSSVNLVNGYGLNSNINVPFNFPVDITSVVAYLPTPPAGAPAFPGTNLWVLDLTDFLSGAAPQPTPLIPLVPGVTDAIADYTYRVSTATDAQGAVMEIVPVKPFGPERTIAFIITAGVKDVLGNDLAADNQFRDIRDACFSGETLSNAILERIKNLAVCPILQAGAAAFNVPASDFMVSWTMTTQSIGEALANVAAAAEAEPAVLINSTLTTASLGVPLGLPFPGGADLYTGTIQIPYFMSKADPLFSTWQSASGLPISLDPNPVATEQLTIPLFAVIPNSTGCPAGKPVTGWPVTIYQHGVSRNRVDAFLLGEAFAAACTAIVAIDLPLHGVLDASNPFFQGPDNPVPFNAFGDNERHFYLDDFTIDIGGAGLIPGLPDGEVDNGTEMFAGAVLAPASGRDNFRQAASDLIHLARTVPTLDLDGNPATTDFDGSRISFVSSSLGSLLGTIFLGVDDTATSATLENAAGNWTKTMLGSQDFGGAVRDVLAGLLGLQQNTLGFDEYLRDLQTVIEDGDPINYAAAAADLRPVLVHMFLNDPTVPNEATDAVVELLGSSELGFPGTPAPGPGLNVRVTYVLGGHSSIINPAADAGDPVGSFRAFMELQAEAANFSASGGSYLPIADPGVVLPLP